MPYYHLITPIDLKPQPDVYERTAARLCAEKFQSDILFVKRGISTTPDIQVVATGQFWEIKNIQGRGKHTIEDNLRKASKQSENIIISLLRSSRMSATRAESRIRYILKISSLRPKRVILITKDEKIVEIR